MPRPPSVPRPYIKSNQLGVCLRAPHTKYRKTVYLGNPSDPDSSRRYAEAIVA